MRPSIIELLKALQAMQGPRMIIAHARLFRVAIGNALVSFHDGSDGGFAFSSQAGEFGAGHRNLLGQSREFSLAFVVRRSRALTFAGQTIRLLREFLETVFQLPGQLV